MNRFWRLAAALGLAASPLLKASPSPTPTPTPKPKLGGGFGRAVATPALTGATGQSLADVVRAAEKARSKEPAEKKPGVKIDNTTLVTDPTKGRLTTARGAAATLAPAVRPAVTPAPGRAPIAPAPTVAAPPPGGPSSDEIKWRDATRLAKKRVEDAKLRVQELDAAVHKLENDFYAWDDGQYRDRVIKPAWDKTKDELVAARGELAEAEKDLADLPEKARKAGALPGWLRE